MKQDIILFKSKLFHKFLFYLQIYIQLISNFKLRLIDSNSYKNMNMLFENCQYHSLLPRNIIKFEQDQPKLVCSECFIYQNKDYQSLGVLINQNSKTYFLRWNQYLIDELNSLSKIVSEEGYQFMFQTFNLSQTQSQKLKNWSKINVSADPKQILIYVISQQINILRLNLVFVSQCRFLLELLNPAFLKDLYSIITKKVERILEPLKQKFKQILKLQLNFIDKNFCFKQEIIQCIQNIRHLILKDWASNCIIENTKDQKGKIDINDRLETQNSLSKSIFSRNSLSFQQDENEKDDILVDTQDFDLQQQSNIQEKITNMNLSVSVQLQQDNDFLRAIMRLKQDQIEQIKKRLQNSEEQKQNWKFRYEILQEHQRKTLTERIPQIEEQMNLLNQELENLGKMHNDQITYISQLQERVKLLTSQNQNLLANQQQPSYYLNPKYQSNKINEQLLQQIIQLESKNMYQNEDIKLMIRCIELTRKFLEEKVNVNIQDNRNKTVINQKRNQSLIKQWQNIVIPKLKSLKSIRVKQG